MGPIAAVIVTTFLAANAYVYLAAWRPTAALVSSPFAAIALLVLGYSVAGNAGWWITCAFIPASLAAIYLTRARPVGETFPDAFSKYSLVAFVAIFGAFLFIPTLIAMATPIAAVAAPGPILMIVTIALTVRYMVRTRESIAADVISTIGAVVRQNLPLMQGLALAAAGRKDKRARVLQRISSHLWRGNTLPAAIRLGFRACPGYVVGALEAAGRVDQLPQALQRLEEDMAEKARKEATFSAVHAWYPLLILLASSTMILGVCVWIAPKCMIVYRSLGTGTLPASTRLMIGVASAVPSWVFPMALALLVFVCIPLGIWVVIRPRRADRPRPLSVVGDWLKWRLPLLHRVERERSLLQTTECLRLSVEAGMPIDQAIANAQGLDVNVCFRPRLRKWLDRVQRGQDVSAAAAACGMGRGLAWAFDRNVNPGGAPEALAALERAARAAFSYRRHLLRTVGWTMSIVGVGVFVGFFVLGVFAPLAGMYEFMIQKCSLP